MKWMTPTMEAAFYVGHNLRREDAEEVALSHGVQPVDAVVSSFVNSRRVAAFETEDGEPCGMCGVNGSKVWMLGTPRLLESARNRWQLAVAGRQWVDARVEELGPLYNYVYAKNERSIKWLSHLGFTVDTPEPYGYAKALFRRFWRCS